MITALFSEEHRSMKRNIKTILTLRRTIIKYTYNKATLRYNWKFTSSVSFDDQFSYIVLARYNISKVQSSLRSRFSKNFTRFKITFAASLF